MSQVEPAATPPLANAPASWSMAAEISADDLDPPQRFPRWVLAAGALLLGALCAGLAIQFRSAEPPPTTTTAVIAVPIAVDVPAVVAVAAVTAPTAVTLIDENIREDDFNLKELPARRKARGLANKGKAKLEIGSDEQARGFLERAAALDPTLPEAWRDLAVARLRLSDNAGARSASEKYARLAPGPDAQALLRLVE